MCYNKSICNRSVRGHFPSLLSASEGRWQGHWPSLEVVVSLGCVQGCPGAGGSIPFVPHSLSLTHLQIRCLISQYGCKALTALFCRGFVWTWGHGRSKQNSAARTSQHRSLWGTEGNSGWAELIVIQWDSLRVERWSKWSRRPLSSCTAKITAVRLSCNMSKICFLSSQPEWFRAFVWTDRS